MGERMPRMFWSRDRGDDDLVAAPGDGRGRARWVVPVVTLVLGLLLGAVAVWFVLRASTEPTPVTAQPTPEATTPTVSDEVAVPRACLNIADGAQELQRLVDQAMKAAGKLDAAGLSALVRQIDEQQAALRDDTVTCQRGVATATAVTPPSTVTATATVPAEPTDEPTDESPDEPATPEPTPTTTSP